MARIIPWKLPDVKGGSIGGYTPAPTPVTPSNDPYDFGDLVFTPEFEFAWLYHKYSASSYRIFKYAECKITMSGVTILNSVEVAQVVADIEVSSGAITATAYDESTSTMTVDEQSLQIDITSLMTPSGGVITSSEYSGKDSSASNMSAIQGLPTYIVMKEGGAESVLYSNTTTKDDTYPTIDSITSDLTLQKITVYNVNGVALQEYTPGE